MMLDNQYPGHFAPYCGILDRFGPGRAIQGHWYAECPACAKPGLKLSFWLGDGGRLMMGCWRNCAKTLILRCVGLAMRDLYPQGDPKRFKPTPTAHYDYFAADGTLRFRVVRLQWDDGRGGIRKTFKQCRPNGPGRWTWNMDGVERVLFHLQQMLNASPSRTVLVCEGEKDVLTAESIGFLATTNAGGARQPWLESYSEALSGRNVVVVADPDDVGRRHAFEAAGSLLAHDAASVRLASFPIGDLTCFVESLREAGVRGIDAAHAAVAKSLAEWPQWRPARRLAQTA